MLKFTNVALAGTVLAMACAVSPSTYAQTAAEALTKPDSNPPALWSTPGDGRLVMLLRNTAGLDKPIPLRVRVCVTNLTGSNNSVNLTVWTTANPWDGGVETTQQQARHLELGDCVEIDRPAAVIVQDSTVTGTSSGYYQLLEQTPVPPSFIPSGQGGPPDPRRKQGRSISLSEPEKTKFICKDIVTPGGTTPTPTKDFYRRCDWEAFVVPKPGEGMRICIGNNFVTWQNPPQQINYPASLLELVIGKEYLPPKDKPSDYDYNWNPVTPNGCRDVFAPTTVTFMVGPKVPVVPWDASKVTAIHTTTQIIRWIEK